MYALRIAQNGLLVLQIVDFLFSMPVVYRPHPSLAQKYADATAHAQAPCWKRSSSHETAMPQYCATVATERAGYVLYRALVIFVSLDIIFSGFFCYSLLVVFCSLLLGM